MVWSNDGKQKKHKKPFILLDRGFTSPDFELEIDVFCRKTQVFQIRSDVFIGDYFSIKQQIHLQTLH